MDNKEIERWKEIRKSSVVGIYTIPFTFLAQREAFNRLLELFNSGAVNLLYEMGQFQQDFMFVNLKWHPDLGNPLFTMYNNNPNEETVDTIFTSKNSPEYKLFELLSSESYQRIGEQTLGKN